MTGRRGLLILLTVATWGAAVPARELTFEDRVAAQKAIEQVYWNHRIWPKENPGPKPPLSAVLSDEEIKARVEAYLKGSDALDTLWQRPIRGEDLQAELDRMAKDSRDPQVLRELFEALGNDPYVIAETLVRQTLAGRLVRERLGNDEPFETWWSTHREALSLDLSTAATAFTLPALGSGGCTVDSWTPTLTEPAQGRKLHRAVWTGSEMIVWGGDLGGSTATDTGGRYNPSTDSWIPISTGEKVPTARISHTAVWTGTAMIVWGGFRVVGGANLYLNDGGRYDPLSDSWTPTSTAAGVPVARRFHTAVWTGSRMIVWGGEGSGGDLNTGGRYDPAADSWQATSSGINVPSGRRHHTAVWTGSEMIVWGGFFSSNGYANTGGRYNPTTDSWTPTSTGANVPAHRYRHTAVWTGSEMIVWGGHDGFNFVVNNGGRYVPSTDSWTPTSISADTPSARHLHSAVWTGSLMIVWGGNSSTGRTNTGGWYQPSTDSWLPMLSVGPPPAAREDHTAVWTGTQMIVWGGALGSGHTTNTGGRYDLSSTGWFATSTGPVYVPTPRADFSAVWTGAEMIVWGGFSAVSPSPSASGGRYVPATDTWTPTSTNGAPAARSGHTAIWTGTEMIVWGGSGFALSGRRYRPSTDTWQAMSSFAPGRIRHSAVWTGTQMIVWGGQTFTNNLTDTGGIYTPASNTWTAIAMPPIEARGGHTAIWTGTEMIVWGGSRIPGAAQTWFNNGARYSPSTNAWTLLPMPQGLAAREFHTAVWTGTQMIVWGGYQGIELNTGGRYDPSTNAWSPTSTFANVPPARYSHTAVWTGKDMIVWGGYGGASGGLRNDGGRYEPASDLWSPTSTRTSVPAPRYRHGAVWTGTEMIVWGGFGGGYENSGARYCACADRQVIYRDDDADGEGSALTPTAGSCDGTVPPGYVATGSDCNDGDPNNWDSCGTCVDGDGDSAFAGCDRYLTIVGPDCNDADAATFAGAPEVNDGIDNQCAVGETGYGLIDELSGTLNVVIIGSDSYVIWESQSGATSYEGVRATSPEFASGCTTFVSEGVSILDTEVPAGGGAFYYLVRPLTPYAGSFGLRSDGAPRAVCP